MEAMGEVFADVPAVGDMIEDDLAKAANATVRPPSLVSLTQPRPFENSFWQPLF